MAKFTVIGMYDDTGQAFADSVEAADASEAMRLVAACSLAPSDLCIIGAIEGEHTLAAPCEDSGKTAFAIDLLEEGNGTNS